MEDFFFSKKLYLPLGSKPEGIKAEDWNLLDRQVLEMIHLMLSKNVAHNFAKEKTTVGMMHALENMYEKPSANNKVYLMKKLFNLRMPKGGSVVKRLNSFNTVVNQLVSMGIKFDDEICALILLVSLPNIWEPTRVAITNSIGNAKLQFIDITNTILVEKVYRKDSNVASTLNSVLNVDN